MDERNGNRGFEDCPGMICKAASLAPGDATEEELKAINKYAIEPLKAEDVFVFKAVLCDNELDRQFEQFSLKALQDLQKLFVGKTVIKDHWHSADNQVARIYATELIQDGKKVTKSGELYTQLVARMYMLRSEKNADLIAEIKGGIKKEGSVGFSASSVICSICGTDNAKTYCRHFRGRSYEKEGGAAVCTFTLASCRDAYEFSLVAVPAQRGAGVSKSYTGEIMHEADQPEGVNGTSEENEKGLDDIRAEEMAIRARLGAAKAKTIIH